jgi:tetratricopeptide (TPR) repeat protein
MKTLSSSIFLFFALSLLCLNTGCSQKAKLEDHLVQGNASFKAGDYKTAEIEYKNVLQIDSDIGQALGNLGLIYYRQGRSRQAYPFLTRIRDVEPENLEYRSALGSLLLEAGDAEAAWDEALFLLGKDPTNTIAPLILQSAAGRLKRIDEARATLSTLRSSQNTAAITVALGILDANEGKLDTAKTLFEDAIELDPNYSDAHSALGNVIWAQQGAEAAEASHKAAYDSASDNVPKQLRYVQFKLRTGDAETAKELLNTLLHKMPNYTPGLTLKAQIAASEQRLDDAIELSDKVLNFTPYNPAAILLSSRLKVGKGEAESAVRQLERLTEIYPELAIGHYQLALANLANKQLLKAAANLLKTLAIDPNNQEAILMQAALNARQGSPEDATRSLEKLLETNPENTPALSLLAQVHLAGNRLNKALEIYQSLSELLPSNPQPPQMAGDVLLRLGQRESARTSLEASLERNSQYLPAFEGLTDLDIADKQFDSALSRIDTQMATYPDSEILHFLKGKVLIAQDQGESGETALRKAIELKPTFRQAYILLAAYYTSTKQPELAIQRLNALIDVNPEDIDALLQLGSLYEQQSDFNKARQSYQKLLTLNANHGPALNNLAYIQTENFNETDKAYELAMRARNLLPSDPSIADTLGWIYYKRGDYDLALSLVKESIRKIAQHPMILYHLGKIQNARNDNEATKAALTQALELGLDGEQAEEAKEILAEIK